MQATVIEFRPMAADNLPNRIREWRKRRDLTQLELGEKVGLSAVHIGHLETGRREVSLSHLRAIARELDVSTADLLSLDDNPLSATPRGQRLMSNWGEADETGRQAIERVAESLVAFRPQEDETVRRMPRRADTGPATPAASPGKKAG